MKRFLSYCVLSLLSQGVLAQSGTIQIPATQPTIQFNVGTREVVPAPPPPPPPPPGPPLVIDRALIFNPQIPAPLVPTTPNVPDPQAEKLWRLLQDGGYVLLMRHGRTDAAIPDVPGGVTIGDCSTQRPLSAQGRADAQRLATVLARRKVPLERIFSSEFCRAQEHGNLGLAAYAKHGQTTWDRLNYLSDPLVAPRLPEYTADVKARIAAFRGLGNLLLISHVTNTDPILSGTEGTSLAEGEFAIVRPSRGGRFEYLGRIAPSAW